MTQRIIYQNQDGGVSIIIPTAQFLESFSIQELAKKDVPAGVAYKIINTSDIPTDRAFREAWEVNISNPDGYGIGAEAWFLEQEAKNSEVRE